MEISPPENKTLKKDLDGILLELLSWSVVPMMLGL
jgi:hypothetical protein